MKKLVVFLLALSVFACGAYSNVGSAEAKTTKAAEAKAQKDLETARSRLDAFLKKHVDRCNLAVRPCKTQPSISKRDGKVVASYISLDPSSISTEVLPSESRHFQYIARVKYVENHFESVAATREEALKGPFHRVKSRRLTEIARYVKGQWSL